MSLKEEYFDYLKHFGKTVPVSVLAERQEQENVIALRHDIDHDLDLALEMGYWENKLGFQATYYLLHTANYWQDQRLVDKCLQIQDFGHEIGLHINVITEWLSGTVNDIEKHLRKLLTPLREAGINIQGISTHGDRACYQKRFINHWCFSELRSRYIGSSYKFSAEGIPENDVNFQISLPEDQKISTPDGRILPLWSVSMEDLDLKYDAVDVPYDFYFTDSGGSWKRSPNPLNASLQRGRHQVLIHPIYWRGEPKVYFFLSTARSGTKWLVNFLGQATPVTAKHEFSLNHRYQDGRLTSDKRTAHGFVDLIKNSDEVEDLLWEIHDWVQTTPKDYAEANVYLEQFSETLNRIFPAAKLVHLHRDPRAVVRSIINRDWYDTPEDSKHPPVNTKDWLSLSQFEKACWYVRQTNLHLLSLCKERLAFEFMVRDLNYLTQRLESIGIPVFPRLAALEFGQIINGNQRNDFPNYSGWSAQQQHSFNYICSPILSALGYDVRQRPTRSLLSTHNLSLSYYKSISHIERRWKYLCRILRASSIKRLLISFKAGKRVSTKFGARHCRVEPLATGLLVTPEENANSYIVFSAKAWHHLAQGEGFKHHSDFYYRGSVGFAFSSPGKVALFALMYDRDGQLAHKRLLGYANEKNFCVSYSFKPLAKTLRFSLALYTASATAPKQFTIQAINLESRSLKF